MLRPNKLIDFVNQVESKEQLKQVICSAKKRNCLPEHILFYGNAGLGKTTLALLTATELSLPINTTIGGLITDEMSLLLKLPVKNGNIKGILFIDEIHRIKPRVQENVYSLLEDGILHTPTGPVKLDKLVVFGATTDLNELKKPFRDRFPVQIRLKRYPVEDMVRIGEKSCQALNISIDPGALQTVCTASRGVPRLLNNMLFRIRDYNLTYDDSLMTSDKANVFLTQLPEKFDRFGLSEVDRDILKCLQNSLKPMGIKNLAFNIDENPETVETIYEPFLLVEGYMQRGRSGREITKKGLDYLNQHKA